MKCVNYFVLSLLAIIVITTPTFVHADFTTPIRAYEPQSDNDLKEYLFGIFNLTGNGTPYWTNDNPSSGWSYATNYTNDRHFFASGSGIPTGTTPTTVSMWIRLKSDNANNNAYISWGDATACEWRGMGAHGTNNSLTFLGNTGTCDHYGGSVIPTNVWTHVAYTYDGAIVRMYMNGTLVTNKTMTLATAASTTVYVGALSSFQAAQQGFDGYITQLYIYNETLNGGNISRLYNAGSGCPASRLSSNCASGANIITVNLFNNITGASIGSITFGNVTGSLTFNYFNITSTGFCATYTGNGTGTNCTTSGSGASTFFNTSSTKTITGTDTVVASSYQGLIMLSAYQLYTNTTINTFNATVSLAVNTTTSGVLLLKALNGSNNILVQVLGNYSQNVTCSIPAPLQTASCNSTGFYDDRFTIGGTNVSSGAGILSFTATMTNATIGAFSSVTTTTGNATFRTLQGYHYTFTMNATGLEALNVTIPANASTNLYNFSLRTSNTFDFTIFNESTNTQITENVTLQIISGDYAANYTVVGGNITVGLLTPGDYTITYWLNPAVPRDYYYTLTPQSFNTIRLYVIDESISQFYLPIVLNQNTVPIGNVTIQLLRDYIISGNTHEYRIVEMARTDTNGQAVLRVVPNTIDYKLIISDGSHTLATTPTKFTSSTNTYTLNTQSNPVQSLVAFPSISKALTFDNATLSYTFSWSDTENIVTAGCLLIWKFKNGVQTTDLNGCTNGASGSIVHTVNDTNNTRYLATATLTTSTEYSTLPSGTLGADFDNDYLTFGVVGFIFAFVIFITFAFVGGESGIAGMLVSGFIGILLAGAVGFIASTWTVTVGIAIIVLIIIYRLQSR